MAARKCSSGAGKWALGVTDQHVDVVVVLLRVEERKLRHCSELATTARRWRPAVASGYRGARAGGHQGREKNSRPGGEDAWEVVAAGGGARVAVPAVNGGDRSSAEGGSGGGQRRKKQRAVRRTIL
jgi:hypothetical protein